MLLWTTTDQPQLRSTRATMEGRGGTSYIATVNGLDEGLAGTHKDNEGWRGGLVGGPW